MSAPVKRSQRVLSGVRLPRREPKVPYNGAAGVPIREEILRRDGETVITRNAYGAHCLNTPNVLFVDIDFDGVANARLFLVILALFLSLRWLPESSFHSFKAGAVLSVAAIATSWYHQSRGHAALRKRCKEGGEQAAKNRIERFLVKNPSWSLRLYRTPNGLRVLATHQTFEPSDPAVAECFARSGADPIYRRMCSNQQCFRTRLTAKPWRIGIVHHLRPQPGVWPVAPDECRCAKRGLPSTKPARWNLRPVASSKRWGAASATRTFATCRNCTTSCASE